MKTISIIICMTFMSFLGFSQVKAKKVNPEVLPKTKEEICNSISFSFEGNASLLNCTTEQLEKVQVVQKITKSDTNYYVSFRVPGNIIIEEPKGIYVLIDEYRKIVLPELTLKLEANKSKAQGNEPYLYSAFIQINYLQFMEIAMHGVVGFKLDIFETSLTEDENKVLKKATTCIWNNMVKAPK